MPDSDPDLALFRRRAAELLCRQLAGQAPPPGRISEDRLAAELGLSRRQTRRLLQSALQKLRTALSDSQP